jgi:hypothetical protein
MAALPASAKVHALVASLAITYQITSVLECAPKEPIHPL